MSRYLSVEFEGNSQSVSSFFEQKGLISNFKRVSNNRLFFQVPEDNYDEVLFFKTFVLDDFKGEKILNVY